MIDTSAQNVLTFSSPRAKTAITLAAWLPVLFGLSVICTESTRSMGADHTVVWLNRLCTWFTDAARWNIPEMNHLLRKNGHFFGYGTLGLFLSRAWLPMLGSKFCLTWSRLRMAAAGAGILSTALVASLDEIHQSFLPNRGSSVWDVLLDTSGALTLLAIVLCFAFLRRRSTLARLMQARSARAMVCIRGMFHVEHSPAEAASL